jgi:hypothetical protein
VSGCWLKEGSVAECLRNGVRGGEELEQLVGELEEAEVGLSVGDGKWHGHDDGIG